MWTKLKISAFLLIAASFVFAANNTQTTNKNRKQRSQTQQTQTKTSSVANRTQSPVEPTLKKNAVDYLLKRIESALVTNRFPSNLSSFATAQKNRNAKSRFVFKSEYMILLTTLRNYVMNPDLEEATAIRKSWFVNVGKNLAKFQQPIQNATYAIGNRNDQAYRAQINQMVIFSRQLSDALKNPVKIPKEEWELIRQKNYKRRLNEYYQKMRSKSATSQQGNTAK